MPDHVTFTKKIPIFEKIRRAYEMNSLVQEASEKHAQLNQLLDLYREELKKSRDLMLQLEVSSCCASCATRTDGSGCCGNGIEDWYDEVLLLINLLLGCDIPQERIRDNACLFLGNEGCSLLARYHFCVNYLCGHITKKLSPQQLRILQAQYGRELSTAWEIERTIRKIFSNRSL